MATFTTANATIPDQLLDPFVKKITYGSAVAQLSSPEPMKFGAGAWDTFNIGEAEFVGEGAQKGSTTVTRQTGRIQPYKFQVTVRFTDEVKWANEDHQLLILERILARAPEKLARALDYGVIHAVNPATLTTVPSMVSAGYLANTTATAEETGDIIADLDAAYAAVLGNSYVPNGIALAPAYAAGAVLERDSDKKKLFPEFQPTTEASRLEGFRTSTSDTVGLNGVLAVAGDFDAVRWGIQKSLGIEEIRYGDPDGGGDLQRVNEVAYRTEIVYGWGIADDAAFATITEVDEG